MLTPRPYRVACPDVLTAQQHPTNSIRLICSQEGTPTFLHAPLDLLPRSGGWWPSLWLLASSLLLAGWRPYGPEGSMCQPTAEAWSIRVRVARAPKFDWLNKGVFISVVGRQIGGVVHEVYLVG